MLRIVKKLKTLQRMLLTERWHMKSSYVILKIFKCADTYSPSLWKTMIFSKQDCKNLVQNTAKSKMILRRNALLRIKYLPEPSLSHHGIRIGHPRAIFRPSQGLSGTNLEVLWYNRPVNLPYLSYTEFYKTIISLCPLFPHFSIMELGSVGQNH